MKKKMYCRTGGVFREAEKRASIALSAFPGKYYSGELNPYNGVMYCNFLYWLSHYTYINGYINISDKIYSLNKVLHGVELFYEIKLPSHWSCEHPLGSVMGRGEYGDYFFFYQGCTVGASWHKDKLLHPIIGNHVTMYSNSKVLGCSHIGNNTILSANSYVINENIPDNSIVFGQSPHLVIKENIKN